MHLKNRVKNDELIFWKLLNSSTEISNKLLTKTKTSVIKKQKLCLAINASPHYYS